MAYHLLYQPADDWKRRKDRLLAVMETDEPNDVMLALKAVPDAIALELEAKDSDEALDEIGLLGFCE